MDRLILFFRTRRLVGLRDNHEKGTVRSGAVDCLLGYEIIAVLT